MSTGVGGRGTRLANCAAAKWSVGGGTRGLNTSTADITSPQTHQQWLLTWTTD